MKPDFVLSINLFIVDNTFALVAQNIDMLTNFNLLILKWFLMIIICICNEMMSLTVVLSALLGIGSNTAPPQHSAGCSDLF